MTNPPSVPSLIERIHETLQRFRGRGDDNDLLRDCLTVLQQEPTREWYEKRCAWYGKTLDEKNVVLQQQQETLARERESHRICSVGQQLLLG